MESDCNQICVCFVLVVYTPDKCKNKLKSAVTSCQVFKSNANNMLKTTEIWIIHIASANVSLLIISVFSAASFHESWKRCLRHGGRNAATGVDRTSASVWSARPCSCGFSVRPSCPPRFSIWCRSTRTTAQHGRSPSSLRSPRTWQTSPSECCSLQLSFKQNIFDVFF